MRDGRQKAAVLVSGVGAAALGPGALENLREATHIEITTVGMDANPAAVGRHFADRFEVVPFGGDSEYAKVVEALVVEMGIDLILPLGDGDLVPLLEIGARMNIPVAAPNLAVTSAALDKGLLLERLHRSNPDAIFARVARERAEVAEAAREAGYPDTAVVVKPCFGTGARGAFVLSAQADRRKFLFERSALPELTLEWYVEMLPETFPPLVVSPRIEGVEYTVTCLTSAESRLTVPLRRERFSPGVTTAGAFDRRHDVIEACEALVEEMGIVPICNIQLVHDGEQPRIFEVNPRLSTTGVIWARAGLNLPEALVLDGLGMPVPTGSFDWSLRFERYQCQTYFGGSG